MCPFMWETGDKVFVYSDAARILLQLRREVPTQQDILAPSFKTAVSLTEGEALALAAELLSVVASRRGFQPESCDEEPE
jgi:hypothetical protein